MALVPAGRVEATSAQRRTIEQVLAREPIKVRALAELEPNGSVRLEFNRHRSLYVQRDGRLTRR
jgi:hypothetical protein